MNKGQFEYPMKVYTVGINSPQKSFNISGAYFEYRIYTMPDTYSSGSYRVTAWLEEGY